MARSSKRRSRKSSFLGRLKPLIGRLRGKEQSVPEAKSPTSVADLFKEPNQYSQPDPFEDYIEEEGRLHLEDHGTILVRKHRDSLSSLSQSTEKVATSEENAMLFKGSSSQGKTEMQPGQLLRDFPNATSDTVQAQWRPVSPIRTSHSSDYECSETLANANKLKPTYASAAVLETPAEETYVKTVESQDTEHSMVPASRARSTATIGGLVEESYVETVESSRAPNSYTIGGRVEEICVETVESEDTSAFRAPNTDATGGLNGVSTVNESPERGFATVEVANKLQHDGNNMQLDGASNKTKVPLNNQIAPNAVGKSSPNETPSKDCSILEMAPGGIGSEKSTESTNGSPPKQQVTPRKSPDEGITDNNGDNVTVDHETDAVPDRTSPEGLTVDVIAPRSKYKGKKVTIIKVQKRVKVKVVMDNNTVKETWLGRSSLSHNGVTPFPPSEKTWTKTIESGAARDHANISNAKKSEQPTAAVLSKSGAIASEINKEVGGSPAIIKRIAKNNDDDSVGKQTSRSTGSLNCDRNSSVGPGSTANSRSATGTKNNNELRPGARVYVTGSKKYEAFGTVVKVNPVMVTVDISGYGERRVKKSGVELVAEGVQHEKDEEGITRNRQTKTKQSKSSQKPETRRTCKTAPEDVQVNDWRIVDSDKGANYFGVRKQTRSRFELKRSKKSTKKGLEGDFLSHLLGDRLWEKEIPLTEDEIQEPVPAQFSESDGSRFELISAKTYNDGERSSFGVSCSPQKVVLKYCKVSGPGLQPIDLKNELEKIADFGSLDPVKVICRLELLQSPAYKFKKHPFNEYGGFPLDSSIFCEIDETGNEGCGFICEKLLVHLLGGNKAAKRACAIQMRLYVPKIGVMKGMLCKKRIHPGTPQIQIPPSMIKAGPPKDDSYSDKAFLIITRNGVHPSLVPSATNNMVGRLLNGTGTTKSFRSQLQKKKLSDMILRLWKGLGVPNKECTHYAHASQNEKSLQHAFVVGLADPTNELPPGTVFCPGLPNAHKELFVTRSPCIESSDGRIIPQVTTQPSSMSQENWEFLQTFSFGTIIFSNPLPGEIPMPVLIADGDLDGDLYFICWNQRILDCIEALPMDSLKMDEETPSTKTYDEEWLTKAQERMVDLAAGQMLSHVIGRLYNAAQRVADASDEYINDRDYTYLAKAYKEALKIEKHGGKVKLPGNLFHHIPAKHHCMLKELEEENETSFV